MIDLAALDGTGFESQHVSHYYVRRRAAAGKYWQKLTYQRFPKAGLLCHAESHLVLAVVPERGPGPDIKHFRPALDAAVERVPIEALAADAAYDAEHAHEYAREEHGVRTLIPARIGRPTTKPPRGYWRRQMHHRLQNTRYSQRWQIETVHSMLKRLLGSALRARKYWSQCREITLRTITLNLMILRRQGVFYRAPPRRFLQPAPSTGFDNSSLRKEGSTCGQDQLFGGSFCPAARGPRRIRPAGRAGSLRREGLSRRGTCARRSAWPLIAKHSSRHGPH